MPEPIKEPTPKQALYVVVMAQRFLMPYAFAGRSPTEAEIATALQKLAAEGVGEDDLSFFALTIRDVFREAGALLKTAGST